MPQHRYCFFICKTKLYTRVENLKSQIRVCLKQTKTDSNDASKGRNLVFNNFQRYLIFFEKNNIICVKLFIFLKTFVELKNDLSKRVVYFTS